MNKYIIVHGSFGSPFGNWFSWLYNELSKDESNIVFAPQFPIGINLQNYNNWSDLLDYYKKLGFIDENTTIIGHSIAPVFITKYLLENNIKVKKLVFVSGFNNLNIDGGDYDKVNSSFFISEDISKIKNLSNDIICLYSNNDPYVPFEAVKDFADKVSSKQVLITNGGHLNSESGYNTFVEILKHIG